MSSRAHASDGGRRTGVLLALAVTLSVGGCAASAALRQGRDAERRQDYDRAVVEYTRAVRLNPNNIDARVALERTKLRASQDHYARGRRLAAVAKLDEALIEYETAAELKVEKWPASVRSQWELFHKAYHEQKVAREKAMQAATRPAATLKS